MPKHTKRRSYSYDRRGRPIKTTEPDGSATTIAYGIDGSMFKTVYTDHLGIK